MWQVLHRNTCRTFSIKLSRSLSHLCNALTALPTSKLSNAPSTDETIPIRPDPLSRTEQLELGDIAIAGSGGIGLIDEKLNRIALERSSATRRVVLGPHPGLGDDSTALPGAPTPEFGA